MNEHLIVQAITALRSDINSRLGELREDLNRRFEDVDQRLVEHTDLFAIYDNRIKKNENFVTRAKQTGLVVGGIAGFFGIDHAKALWTSLIK